MSKPRIKIPLVEPTCYTFNSLVDPSAETKFLKILREQENALALVPIKRPTDLLLSPDGRMKGRYKVSQIGLWQIASQLSVGLSALLQNLFGIFSYKHHAKRLATDVGLAIDIYNNMASLRYKQLSGWHMVIDKRLNTVEGVMDYRGKFFTNRLVFERVSRHVATHRARPADFLEAVLTGRSMMVRYICRKPAFEISSPDGVPDTFYSGYALESNEVDAPATFGTSILIRKLSDTTIRVPFDFKNRVTHMRNDGDKRFEVMLTRLDFSQPNLKLMRQRVLTLIQTNLGLGGDPEEHEDRHNFLVTKLDRPQVPYRFMRRALMTTVIYGSYRSQSMHATRKSWLDSASTRTAYDLFNAISHEARQGYSMETRVAAENLAYSILIGKAKY